MLDTIRRSPAGARFGIHLCLGDFHHTAYGEHARRPPARAARERDRGRVPRRTRSSSTSTRRSPRRRSRRSRTESFYEPLRDLDLPDDTRFIAGFLHESLDTEAHRDLLARIERLSGREVDVAAACGLGRRESDEEAFEQMRETAALLQEPATA